MFQVQATLFLVLVLAQVSLQARKQKTSVVSDILTMKEYKKLLKSKTNVLILFVNQPKAAQAVSDVVREAAETMKGQATLAIVDCSNRWALLAYCNICAFYQHLLL